MGLSYVRFPSEGVYWSNPPYIDMCLGGHTAGVHSGFFRSGQINRFGCGFDSGSIGVQLAESADLESSICTGAWCVFIDSGALPRCSDVATRAAPATGAGALSPLAAICCGLCGGKGRWRSGDELGGGGAFLRAQLLL